jgi:hypothetical protein
MTTQKLKRRAELFSPAGVLTWMSKSTIISSYNIVFCEEMFHSNKVLHNVLIYVLSAYLYLIRQGGVGLELYRALQIT